MQKINKQAFCEDVLKLANYAVSVCPSSIDNNPDEKEHIKNTGALGASTLRVLFASNEHDKMGNERLVRAQNLIERSINILRRMKNSKKDEGVFNLSDINSFRKIVIEMKELEEKALKSYKPNSHDKRAHYGLNLINIMTKYQQFLQRSVGRFEDLYKNQILSSIDKLMSDQDKTTVCKLFNDMVASVYEHKIDQYFHPEDAEPGIRNQDGELIDKDTLTALRLPCDGKLYFKEDGTYDPNIPNDILLEYAKSVGDTAVLKCRELVDSDASLHADAQQFIEEIRSMDDPVSEIHMPRYRYGATLPINVLYRI